VLECGVAVSAQRRDCQVTDLAAALPLPSPPTVDSRSARVVFADPPFVFRRMVWRGAWLELITAGFYRFWLATNMRRHLWSHTSIEGDSLEYSGTARELLIGFLVALAILVPIYLVYFLVGVEAERYQAFASVPLALFLYAFYQFAIFRARRYRASRTVWRGVRFWMTGSGWIFSLRACLWGLFAIVTLGIALPWREAALERYRMRHTHYGDLQGGFAGTGWGLFKKVWWLGLLMLPIITVPFVYPAYKAAVWHWSIAGVRFGTLRCSSDLRAGALMGIYWAVIGWSSLLLVIDGIIITAVIAAFAFRSGSFDAASLAIYANANIYFIYAVNVLNYLLLALAINAIMRIYLLRRVWERVANSTTVHGLEAADNVTAMGDAATALGEGFANSLDIGGF
jgi:uncharacterized membrane protein YjgN (DUF898 family)